MRKLKAWVARDPSGALTALTAVAGAVCAALGRPDLTGVLVVVAGAVLGLRTQVTPVSKVEPPNPP